MPITPGIIPIHDFAQVAAFAKRCGASVPARLAERFEAVAGDRAATRALAIEIAAEQVLDLAAQGVHHFHFYTLNRAALVVGICEALGIAPASTGSTRRKGGGAQAGAGDRP